VVAADDAVRPQLQTSLTVDGAVAKRATYSPAQLQALSQTTAQVRTHTYEGVSVLVEDGVALTQPRLVTAGDVKGGRYVTGVTDLVVGGSGLLSWFVPGFG